MPEVPAKKTEITLPPIPQNLFDKREERLKTYAEQKKGIQDFIKENLKEGTDYGRTDAKSKDKTLMKAGSEKINEYMMCRPKLYPDIETHKMWGNRPGSVCYVTYIIDQELLIMIMKFLLEIGMEHEERLVKLLSWGEGRGACEENEKVYGSGSLAGKPLKGSFNRAVKMAEKRSIVDATIRTFGLEFGQDPDYTQTGRLKGDKSPPKSQPKRKEKPLPEENQAVYSSCLTLIQERYKGYKLFSDMLNRKKSIDAVKDNLEKLIELHEVLKKVSDETKKQIDIKEGGGNAT